VKKLAYLFFFIFLYSCSEKPSFQGFWLGAAFEMDKEVYVPFPRIMIAKEDGNFNAYMLGDPDTNWSKWEFKSQLLTIDTTKFLPSEYDLSHDEFIFNGAYKGFYRRLEQPKEFSSSKLKEVLNNSSWESKYDAVYFDSSGEARIRPINEKLSDKACWSIIQEQGHLFIKKGGNQLNCNKFGRFPELVTVISSDVIKVERWEKDAWKEIVYRKTKNKKSDFDLKQFQLCNPYLYRNNPKHRYYYQNTFYKGGVYKINKLFNGFYKAPLNSIESGLIKVEFIVNCQGIPGKYSMLQMDENYIERAFSEEISRQIFQFTKSLKDWNAGKNKEGEQIDTYRFLTFKIKNGQVLEIFP